MLKRGLKRKTMLMMLAAALSAVMVFPSMAATSITSISLGLSYHISEGDTSTNVRVTSGSNKYEVTEVEVTNEPDDDDGWEEGDKPKIKVTVETDEDDYKFSGVSKSDVTVNGDEGTVTSVTKKSSSKLYVYITLDEVEESSSASNSRPQGMPNNQPMQQISQQPGSQSVQTNTNSGKNGWVKDAKGWKYRNDDQTEMKNQ